MWHFGCLALPALVSNCPCRMATRGCHRKMDMVTWPSSTLCTMCTVVAWCMLVNIVTIVSGVTTHTSVAYIGSSFITLVSWLIHTWICLHILIYLFMADSFFFKTIFCSSVSNGRYSFIAIITIARPIGEVSSSYWINLFKWHQGTCSAPVPTQRP